MNLLIGLINFTASAVELVENQQSHDNDNGGHF